MKKTAEKTVQKKKSANKDFHAEGTLTFAEAQNTVHGWIQSYGVRYYSELTNTAILMEEVGELARLMARTYGEQSFKKSDRESSISGEIGDILFVLAALCNQMNISMEDAFKSTIEKNTKRDSTRHKKNRKLNDS
ncbi:MAG TPA: nucleotide pyrophosphohydrolase [Leptospiraceae bacterium]|nr:nucleotide pyrophosphohydrolase [Leptospiraceae bacterium]HMZ60757.1 nucleotide pyrophosphohydrolase [Leptospiraceae bacterium]HNF26706.1 nucleotide pyrophosphohydrolase [Leptospiraceae bacterium]HNH08973.1 nucleotide pyrophosphohydrolase [Leptospiraceae bacterium]HNI28502.1 nucleotide pyrophosphohydrolase [Leptospiraceae bacterium]